MYCFRSSALLLAGALLFAACDSDSVDPPQPDLLPLVVGNQWVLSYTRTYVPANTFPVQTGVDTLRVAGTLVIDEEEWFEVRAIENRGSLVGIFEGFYTNREDGVWKWDDPSAPDGEPFLIYKSPAQPSDTYVLPSENVDMTVTVAGVDVPITTDAGTFPGNRYTFDSTFGWGSPIEEGAALFERSLAPGVGFTRLACGYLRPDEESDTLIRNVTFEWTLISFEG